MHNRLFIFFLILFLSVPLPGKAALYECDQTRSAVSFTLKHLGLMTVSGKFERFAGSFQFNPEEIKASRITLSIHSGSIHSGNDFRDRDLRSPDFFDAEGHPVILFQSKKIQNIRGNEFEVQGNLTIKGITRETVFHTKLLDTPDQSGRLHFFAWAEIKRHDFHLGTSGFNPLLLITNEELRIQMDVQGVPAHLDFVAI